MSESIKHGGEQSHEKLDLTAEAHKNIERIHEKAEQSKETSHEDIKDLAKKAETHAISGKEHTVGEKESTAHVYTHSNQKELKADAYNKSIKHVRRKLSTPDKVLSKVIHNKTVENVSELGSKTIARPSGFLGGGLVTLLGSAFLLYMTRHYGFQYNYLAFFILFVGGYFFGMIAELVIRLFMKRA